MNMKDEIIALYYDKKMTNKLIAIKLNVSSQYITKIVKTDNRYIDEKIRRKNENLIKRKVRKNEYIKRKRQVLKNEQLNDFVELQHRQASGELSGRHTINNRAFKKWNSSIYDYHSRTNEFRVKEEFKDKTSYAVPKKIKWD